MIQEQRRQLPAWPLFIVPTMAAVFVVAFTTLKVALILTGAVLKASLKLVGYVVWRVRNRSPQA